MIAHITQKMYIQIVSVHMYIKVKMVLGASLTSKLQG